MIKYLFLAFFLLLKTLIFGQGCLTCTQSGTTLNDGLIFCVPFTNGDKDDKTNSAFTGTAIGSPVSVPDRLGTPNGAYQFNGSTNFIRYGDILDTVFCKSPNAIYSISGWAKGTAPTFPFRSVIVGKSAGGTGVYEWYIYWDFDGKLTGATCSASMGPTDYIEQKSQNVIPNNSWFHFVYTFDGSQTQNNRCKIYINTVEGVAQTPVGNLGTTSVNTTQQITIGAGHANGSPGTPNNQFNGIVDDIRIYNRILTSAEISELYSGNSFSINHFPDISICSGDSIQLKATGNGISYLWSPSTYLNSATDSTVIAKPATNVSYIVTVTSGSCINRDTINVNVNQNCCIPAQSVVDKSKLVFYAPVKGDATDYAQPSVPTSVLGTTSLVPDRGLNTNCAYDFSNSANDKIISDSSAKLTFDATTSLTLSAWVKPRSIRVGATRILSLYGNHELSLSYGGSLGNPGSLLFTDFDSTTLTPVQNLVSDTVLAPGQWSHVLLTINRSSNTSTLYINGTTRAKGTGANSLITNGGIVIGNHLNAAMGFDGAIDEVRIYKTAVDSNQAYALFTNDRARILTNDTLLCMPGPVPIQTYGAVPGYSWSPATGLNNPALLNPTANTSSSRVYTLTVNNGSCIFKDSVSIQLSTLTTSVGPTTSICPGDSVQLLATGGTTYRWNPSPFLSDTTIANPFAKPSVTTKFYVRVSDGSCTRTDSVTVTLNNTLTTSAGPDQSMCFGDSVQLNATGGTSFLWSPAFGLNDPNIANPKAGPATSTSYIVKASSGFCEAYDTVEVTVNPLPAVDAGGTRYACKGGSILLTPVVSSADQFRWQPDIYLNDSTAMNPMATVNGPVLFTLTATNTATGCSASDNVQVLISRPIAGFTVAPTTGTIPLEVKTTNLTIPTSCTYRWLFDDTIPFLSTDFEPTHIYAFSGQRLIRLVAFDSLGCTDTAWSPLISANNELNIFIPNIITPNGDKLNDLFEVTFTPGMVKQVNGVIYNRWGASIYFFTLPGGSWWNGKVDGEIAPDGVYVYVIEIADNQNHTHRFKGNLTLLR